MVWNTTQLDNETLEMFRNTVVRNTLSIVYCIVILISLPGNGLSLWLLLFRTHSKTPTIIYMINLTITDLAICLFLPFHINYHLNGYNWVFGDELCRVVTIMFYSNMYCSILTMTAISVDRWIGVLRPIWYKKVMKKKYAAMVCLGMWATILMVMYPLESTDLTYKVQELNITTCFDVLKKSMLPSLGHWAVFLFTLFVLLFLIPFIVTVCCYTGIIFRLMKNNKGTEFHKKRRAVLLTITVLFVFTTCFAPNNVILFAHMVQRLFFDKSLYTAYKLTLSLSCLNSCLDPFIYYFASKEFRRKVRKVLGYSNNSSDVPKVFYRKESILSARTLMST
ncbi:P2Y purinoceptor 8 [Lepisosteus oculatus]|uniref:P2Y purinoceptor 8 n=1 Tax=Lepisosteus oculatus TaxID=7918 RepID=UPI0035F513B1